MKRGEVNRTDEELVVQCLEGDTTAYAELVKRHQARVVGTAFKALRDRALAEDLAQEVFLRAYRSLKGFQSGRRFAPWLMAITANRIRDHLKTLGKRSEVMFDLEGVLPSPDATALDRASARQTLRRLDAALMRLPEETREVLRLRFVLGLDYDDVAATLDLPLGTVKSRISRARTRLVEALREEL